MKSPVLDCLGMPLCDIKPKRNIISNISKYYSMRPTTKSINTHPPVSTLIAKKSYLILIKMNITC